ncbi:MAG: hypothetical protein J6T82_04685 [Bacteroidaceae bacterium]|nr:hypothetical protein [Bacteroidaceae bacterium]
MSEATVLRRLVKNEAILAAEVQPACFLFDSFSFARAKEKRILPLVKESKERVMLID